MNNQLAEELNIYWGPENLTRWSERALHNVRIPTASSAFLINVGLPSPGRDISGWRLEWELDLPYFDNARGLRLLGRNRGFSPFLLDESRSGSVIWRAKDDGFERYVNASVEQFAASLVEMDKLTQETWRTMDDPFDKALFARRITAFEGKLRAIEEIAVATKDSMWRSAIFGMRLELK
jgi:hypothetical protein